MPRYSLAALAKAKQPRRRAIIPIRPIQPTNAQAADLYAVAYKAIITRLDQAAQAIAAAYVQPGTVRDSTSDDFGGILTTLGTDLQRIILTITPSIRNWALHVERWHRARWRAAVLTATSVDLDTILLGYGLPETLRQAIDWNASLVRNVAEEGRARIASRVFAAFQRHAPVAELAQEIRESVAMSRRRSLGIASDQVKKLAARLDEERQTEAGIETYTWRHSAKQHPRRFHVARDGHVYRWDQPPEDGPPGTLPYCGCRAQARLEL